MSSEDVLRDKPFGHLMQISEIKLTTGGSSRATYRVRSHDGQFYKLRTAPGESKAQLMEARVRTLSDLFPRFFGRDRNYLLFEFLNGQEMDHYLKTMPPQEAQEKAPALFYKMGQFHARAHQLKAEGASEQLDANIHQWLGDLHSHNLLTPEEWRQAQFLYDETRRDNNYQFYFDLKGSAFDNFMFVGDILYYVDEGGIENIKWMGLAKLIVKAAEGSRKKQKQPNLMTSFIEGYQSSGLPFIDRGARTLVVFYYLVRWLIRNRGEERSAKRLAFFKRFIAEPNFTIL